MHKGKLGRLFCTEIKYVGQVHHTIEWGDTQEEMGERSLFSRQFLFKYYVPYVSMCCFQERKYNVLEK